MRRSTTTRQRAAPPLALAPLLALALSGCGSEIASAPLPTPPITQLSVGAEHTCALLEDGSARCWGSNGAGKLGHEGWGMSPLPVKGLSEAVSISAGGDHSCAALRIRGQFRFGVIPRG